MSKKHLNSWSKEIDDLINGIAGGFLFGVPLLYTMEVWFIGSHAHPATLLSVLVVTYAIIFFINRVEGFRKNSGSLLLDTAAESVETLAIGIFCAVLMLILLQQITWESSLSESLGKIIFEGVPFSFGVALSRTILSGKRQEDSNVKNESSEPKKKGQKQGIWNDTIADINATFIGAIFIGFAIAPTDEVAMLAGAASPPWLLAIIMASLLISYAIVFAADFTDQKKRRQQQGIFQHPIGETVFCYLLSLLASALMLWFFQQLVFDYSWELWLSYSLILGLPATIGGAAGRIAI